MTKNRACANGPTLSRRKLLIATPGLLALPFVARAGLADDPILPIYHEWVAAKREWQRYENLPGNGNWDFPESLAAARREDAAFTAMMTTRATSMAGVAGLAHVIWQSSGPGWVYGSEDYLEESRSFENAPKLALWRSASGQDGLPPGFS
jgi:hypothetical protein